MLLRPGDRLERYVIDAVLGRGGMAVVYRVHHAELGSVHALKVLATRNPALSLRLVQEGRVQGRLRHPNTVAVQDVLRVGDAPALLVEFVEGPSLADWLERTRPTVAQIDALARGILAGVDAAHRLGLVHRDLKPANVLLQVTHTDVTPKVSDFGLAKALDGEAAIVRTQAGTSMGTPIYMAPEQGHDASAVDARADVFSLGALLYELLLGLHEGPVDLMGAMDDARMGRPPDLGFLGGRCPDRWADAVLAALSRSPEHRPADAGALRDRWVGDAIALSNPWSPQALAEARAAAPIAVQTASSGGGSGGSAPSSPVPSSRSDSTYGPAGTMVDAEGEGDPDLSRIGAMDGGVPAPPAPAPLPVSLSASDAAAAAPSPVIRPVTAGVVLVVSLACAAAWYGLPWRGPHAIAFAGEPPTAHSVAPLTLRAATVLDSAGAPLDPQPPIAWSVAPETVARLEGDRVVPVANGTATITATAGGVAAAYPLVVDRLPVEGHAWRSPSLGPMAWIPPGTFSMGSPVTEAFREAGEHLHEVTLSRGYWMMEQEVTQRQWEKLLQVNPVKRAKKEHQIVQLAPDPDLPVYRVDWFDATVFANAASLADGLPACYAEGGVLDAACVGYRLPTEAEWERAARGGAQTIYAGTSSPREVCHYANVLSLEDSAKGFPCEDGAPNLAVPRSYAPNPYGLYDMTGNVAEWCGDWMAPYPKEPVVDPTGPPTGNRRTIRGGPFHYTPDTARIAYRVGATPTYGVDDGIGVRLVRAAP